MTTQAEGRRERTRIYRQALVTAETEWRELKLESQQVSMRILQGQQHTRHTKLLYVIFLIAVTGASLLRVQGLEQVGQIIALLGYCPGGLCGLRSTHEYPRGYGWNDKDNRAEGNRFYDSVKSVVIPHSPTDFKDLPASVDRRPVYVCNVSPVSESTLPSNFTLFSILDLEQGNPFVFLNAILRNFDVGIEIAGSGNTFIGKGNYYFSLFEVLHRGLYSVENRLVGVFGMPFGHVELLNRGFGLSLCGIGGSLRRDQQKDVDNQQPNSAGRQAPLINFLPKWGIVFAPTGLVMLWFGVTNLHNYRRARRGAVLFLSGAILWAYGLATFLVHI